jgi:predicted enzyme related to lactoylglutathione lyase
MIAGGRVIVPRTEIPNLGFFAMFLDSENNMFGLFEKEARVDHKILYLSLSM